MLTRSSIHDGGNSATLRSAFLFWACGIFNPPQDRTTKNVLMIPPKQKNQKTKSGALERNARDVVGLGCFEVLIVVDDGLGINRTHYVAAR